MQECDYVRRDGQVNPDRKMVNNTGAFASLSAAVFYNVLSWRITGQASYANSAAGFIDTWFLHNATAMNPNMEYAQVIRGPKGSKVGTREGILDLHNFAKVASAIQVMRDAKAPAWTTARNSAMVAWSKRYLTWLLTNPLSLAEKRAPNNHGTFWYEQVASIQVLVGDSTGATNTLHEYFDGIYQNQINVTGDQPFEAVRTRPFHYRAYALGGTLVINQIADYLGWNAWNITTAAGTTVQDAVDFSMTLTDAENNDPSELFPSVAAIASHYGDPTRKYATYLSQHLPKYTAEAYYFWDQPLGANSMASIPPSNSRSRNATSTSSTSKPTSITSNSTTIALATAAPITNNKLPKSAAFADRPSIMAALMSPVMIGISLWVAS
ncbi:hypothetical protein FRB96_009691 [Tulasnella sp. 330]|nr:hypothetical protein FRB96_009691 [Tulasnella sp. 330]